MKINKSNALEFATKCIKRAENISTYIKNQIAFDEKNHLKRNYDSDLAEIDRLSLFAKKAMNLLKPSSPGDSFAEQNDSTITKFQIRESVLNVAKQLKDISSFLLKQIEKENALLIDKDYSALLKKLESSMKLLNGEIKLYKDDSTWLLAESQINYGKNEGVRYQIGWKVPLLGRLVDALELQIQKDNKENSAIDHTKLLIKLVDSLKSFDEDLKVYRGIPNAPTIQISKLLNKLTGASFSSDNYAGGEFAAISADEFEKFMSESDASIPIKIPEDRNEFHKIILAVQKKENVSYDEALNICRYGKK